jgi:tetratricopeptide (TPR) repeat protein
MRKERFFRLGNWRNGRNVMDRFAWQRTALLAAFFLFIVQPSRAADDDALRDKALKLNDITGNLPLKGELRLLFKDEAGTKKLVEAAVKMAKEKNQPFNYTGAFILARSAHFVKNFEAAQLFYKIALEAASKVQSSSKIIEVYDGTIDLLIENKKFDDAVKTCQDFLDIEKTNDDDPIIRVRPFIMERMIQALAKQGKFDDAMKQTDDLVERDGKDGWYFLKLRAEIYREQGKLGDAIETYDEVLERLKSNKRIPDESREKYIRVIRYTLTGVYVDDNKIDKAAEQLQALLKDNPDNPTYCNDLGFIWADHDMNLDESEKLIRKALEEDRKNRKENEDLEPEDDKDNPAYLDSLGWVLFKKKDFKEAKKYLEEATQSKEGQHIEILDHLADTHMALGEKDDAIKTWEKALKSDPENLSKRDQERRISVEKKLKKVQESK